MNRPHQLSRQLPQRASHQLSQRASRRVAALSACAALAMVAACGSNTAQSGPVESQILQGQAPLITEVVAHPDAQSGVVAASTQLGLDLISQTGTDNAVTSPASAIIALAMLAATGDGESEAELTAVLGAGGQQRDEAIHSLSQALARYSGELAELDVTQPPEEPFVHLANQVVVTPGFEVQDTYLDALSSWYDAGVLQLELSNPDSKVVLDEWVQENTAGLIEESAIEPSADLVMALQNATLLAAQWAHTFDAHNTAPRDFSPLEGAPVTADFMNHTRFAQFASQDGWAMVELPYGGDGELVAQFFLPPPGVSPTQATPELLAALQGQAADTMVQLALPILDIESQIDLIPLLQERGVQQIFDPNSGALSHISEGAKLYVSAAVQQGRILQHEQGTVAAAVTEISVEAASAFVEEPQPFIADRPHLIVLKDQRTGWDLFHVSVQTPLTIKE